MATGDAHYEPIRVDIYPLLVDGSDDPSGAWIEMDNPRDLSADPEIEKGDREKIRAGGKIFADIKQADQVIGGKISFGLADIPPEGIEVMCGGEVTFNAESPPVAIGYTDPEPGDTQPLFKLRMLAERYREDNLEGYTQLSLSKCTANSPKMKFDQGKIMLPDIDIEAFNNSNATDYQVAWRKILDVDVMP